MAPIFKSKKFWIIVFVVVIIIAIAIYYYRKRTPAVPAKSSEKLVIVSAEYVCPGTAYTNGIIKDVTSILASKIANNSIYIPSPNMDQMFGAIPCGCPDHCTHKFLRVKYRLGNNNLAAQFQDDQTIIINY